MAFATYDAIIAAIAAGQFNDFNPSKIGPAMQGAGVWHSLWTASGTPGVGAAPATTPGTQYSNAAGSINFPAVSTLTRHGLTLGAVASQNCTLMLYDRLVAVSGISIATTGNKTISSAALLRYAATLAVDVQCWLEITTATTTTAAVVSLNSYTNEAGTAARAGATITFPAAATVVGSLIGPMPLQVGDLGIRSVEIGLNVATAAATGILNVVLLKPLAYLPLIANQWNERDLVQQLNALPRIYDTASLALAVLPGAVTALNLWGQLRAAHG